MEFKLAWLYPDLLELYGDSGNITILKNRCLELGIKLNIDKFSVKEDFKVKDYDMIFLGGGSDREQKIFYNDLIKRKNDIIDGIEDDIVFLIICGGYQLFGKYYKDNDGNILDGLGIFNYFTEGTDKRIIGYICTEVKIDGEEFIVAGFENHGGKTYNVENPLGRVISGTGNNEKDGTEGFTYRNLIGTYLHGPLLARNPELTDLIIKKMAKRKGINIKIKLPVDSFESKAKKQIIKELGK